jgi:hypothetical protein
MPEPYHRRNDKVDLGDCYVSIYGPNEAPVAIEIDPETGRVTRISGIKGQAACTEIELSVVGYDGVTAHIEFESDHWIWEAYLVFPGNGPLCGETITILAECVPRKECNWDLDLRIPCPEVPNADECPTAITGRANADLPCIQGRRPVILTVDFQPPLPSGTFVRVLWAFGNGVSLDDARSLTSTTASISQTPRYDPGGPFFPVAFVTVTTAAGSVCATVTINFPQFIAQGGCAPTEDCPVLTINSLVPPKCATVGARASAQASLTPAPAGGAAEFLWAITAPGGRRWQRRTTQASMDTGSGIWQDATTLQDSVVQLNVAGTYEVIVTATVPNTSEDCQPSDSGSFQLLVCGTECPVVDLLEPSVEGCGRQAVVTFEAQNDPPAPTGTEYRWSVQVTGGLRALRTSTTPTTDSSATWSHTNGAVGPMQVQAGEMTASVTVIRPDQNKACTVPTSSEVFRIPACARPPNDQNGPDGDPSEAVSGGCWWLLVLGLIFLVIGGIGTFMAACAVVPGVVAPPLLPVIIGLLIAAIAVLLVGTTLLILWALFCVQVAGCRVLQGLIVFINWLIVSYTVVSIISAILTAATAGVTVGCFAAAVSIGLYLGTLNIFLLWIFMTKPCTWRGRNPFTVG